ncbi:MAG: hypothetical protein WC522_09125 [Candidatus Omnitrophota bacterium]
MNANGQKGTILITTFIIMTALLVMTAAFLYMAAGRVKSGGYGLTDAKALWAAEAGLQQVMYKLKNDSGYRSSPTPLDGDVGDGSYSVTVLMDGSTYTVTSTGTVGLSHRTVTQSMVVSAAPEAFQYAIHSGNDMAFHNCYGTVSGSDVDAGNNISGESHMDFSGDHNEYTDTINPSLTISVYEPLADYTDPDNKTFYAGTYSGIWYVHGNVTIRSGVTLNGSIIAEGNISTQSNAVININPSSAYPALVTGTNHNITLNIKNSTLNGLIYSSKNITINGNNSNNSISGAIMCGNNFDLTSGNHVTITYDSDIYSNPPPGFSGGGATTIAVQKDWNETS